MLKIYAVRFTYPNTVDFLALFGIVWHYYDLEVSSDQLIDSVFCIPVREYIG